MDNEKSITTHSEDIKTAGTTTGKVTNRHKVERERLKFRSLTLTNPNYFGNLKVSPFQPIKIMLSNSFYEELKCFGYNPQTGRLDAIVYIKHDSGYGGGVCSNGSLEYVRFYLSYDHGATWLDQGMSSFPVYDVPGPKPLEYDTKIQINPNKLFCFTENLPRVRAILSWSTPPPANDPGFIPSYGNVVKASIQVEPRRFYIFDDLVKEAKLKLPPHFEEVVNLQQPLQVAQPKSLQFSELAAHYYEKGVPPHRFLFSDVQKMVASPELADATFNPVVKNSLADLKINLSEVIAALFKTDGDTRFEELTCIGLNQGTLDSLAATLTVKLPNGYSGPLCSTGSKEFVAFWVDWGNGAGWTYAGTASVNVYDLTILPPGGLQYSVAVPVDTTLHRQPCEAGPKTARVRAILSWQVAPPPGNPDYVPTWGNREETLVLLKSGPSIDPTDHTPYLESVGNMAMCKIDQTSGLATGSGSLAAFTANQSPFGGTVRITGFILNPPNVMAGAAPFKYRVYVRELPGSGPVGPWQPLNNSFPITITEQNGIGLPVQYGDTQSIDASGWYTYREQMYPNQWSEVAMNVLASWETRGLNPGLWEIMLEAKLPGGTILPAGTVLCLEDGTTRSTVKVRLDEKAPSASIGITGYSRGGGPVLPALSCGTFQVGDVIFGTYSSFDAEGHYSGLSIYVEPVTPANGAVVNPSARSFPVVSTNGESGTWSLDTGFIAGPPAHGPMGACGYIIRLTVADRTIVDSGYIGWTNADSTGFCLKAAGEG